MTIIGFPRIGENRELKKALESYWSSKISESELLTAAKELRIKHYNIQKNLHYVSVNDFSFYDNMLDLSIALGAIPERFSNLSGLSLYFAIARGYEKNVANEMTKWFNTNYHFVVPELYKNHNYKINVSKIKEEYDEALNLGFKPKISLIGLFTFINLAKSRDDKKDIFNDLKNAYFELLKEISTFSDKKVVIEFNEPIFVKGKCEFFDHVKDFYNEVSNLNIQAIVTTYFEESREATEILLETGIYGIGLDFLYGSKNLESLELIHKSGKKLLAGVIDGRNIWIANLEHKLKLLEQIARIVPKDSIILSSSCSLLHVPFGKKAETKMDDEILSWLSFANEKVQELELLESLFRNGINDDNKAAFELNKKINENRKRSPKIHDINVKNRVNAIKTISRAEDFNTRIKIQQDELKYPKLATTTIGSFPQTPELRSLRLKYKKNEISKDEYEEGIKNYIKECIKFQEEIGLDVLVHGEPERNDMVEYFGEQMKGFVFSQNGWVQSYGSRCVKPPIIFGDTSRPNPMTVFWSTFAQSLTSKIVKGMLTGPVTILNWSFVRDDIPRKEVCRQLSLCIADEIDDLQNAGIKIIQVDEAAFKEGYPLRDENIKEYEDFALDCFKISTSISLPSTQIHTHMCYSEFNDIIKTIERMDADVISIETARSGNELLKVFKEVGYANEVGPGIYDIHSPRIPSVDEMYEQIKDILDVLPKEQVWINPDCGLKTRKWEEVKPSLENMIKAVKKVREELK